MTEISGINSYMWIDSLLVYTVIIALVSAVNMLVAFEWTILFLASVVIFNFAIYFGFVFLYDILYFRDNDYMGGVAKEGMGNGQFWLMAALLMMVCFGPMILFVRTQKLWKYSRSSFSLKSASGEDIVEAVHAAKRRCMDDLNFSETSRAGFEESKNSWWKMSCC